MDKAKRKPGRPAVSDDERLTLKSLRMKPKHWEKIDAAGLEAFRAYVDRWRPKPR